ncbi:Uncharacterised protein [Sphingobacterium thalpophilum]|uniref:Uncharacterized protein n=1 Tax=Sphingobacterium thalpophilum TaxID=259 RepID=A0A4U9VQU6_9SPHI|nr:Uncharacterised protein [Sphingobacterium thalpophilum]
MLLNTEIINSKHCCYGKNTPQSRTTVKRFRVIIVKITKSLLVLFFNKRIRVSSERLCNGLKIYAYNVLKMIIKYNTPFFLNKLINGSHNEKDEKD